MVPTASHPVAQILNFHGACRINHDSAKEKAPKCLAAVRIKSRFLAALVIGLFTGARPAEICRLDWKHISMEEDRINVPGDVG